MSSFNGHKRFCDEKEEEVAAVPVTTLSKSQPPTPTPEFVPVQTSNSPVSYPDIASYNFQISKKKRVDRGLDVYYVGVLDSHERSWSFTIATPPCFMVFTKVYQNEVPQSRVVLCPMYRDAAQNAPDAQPFLNFLQHIEDISEYLKFRMNDQGVNTSTWVSPLRIENGLLMGLQAKIKSDTVKAAINSRPYNIRGFLKLNCLYVAPKRCGLSFELVEALPST